MLLDVSIQKESLSVPIEDPFRYDLDGLCARIRGFALSHGADVSGFDIQGLIPKMVKGIAGCEGGCPSDAKGFVSRGLKGFKLEYIEGGILSAEAKLADGKSFFVKMFPDF